MRKTLGLGLLLICLGLAVGFGTKQLNRRADIVLSGAKLSPVMGLPGTAQLTLTMTNAGGPDRLLGAFSVAAKAAEIQNFTGVTRLAIPGQSSPSLSADGASILLTGIDGALEDGRLIPVTLEFETAGHLTTRAKVSTTMMPHAMPGSVVPSEAPVPVLNMSVTQSGEIGWTVALQVEHFTFTPAKEPPQHVPGEGHAHLYLDGLKLQRMYEEHAVIGPLPPGRYEVTVSLNGNTHIPYVDQNGPVAKTSVLVVE